MTDPNHPVDPTLLVGNRRSLAGYQTKHFLWSAEGGITTTTFNRLERRNPPTFDSYVELHDLSHQPKWAGDTKAIVLTGAGDNFCSGGDAHETIGPLMQLRVSELLMFMCMTGELVKMICTCLQPVAAAVDGVCTDADTILAMAPNLRLGTAHSKTAFLFDRVDLAGCNMGACATLPCIIGQGHVNELLYTSRLMSGEEGECWGLLNRLCEPAEVPGQAYALTADLVAGPTFVNGIAETMLHQGQTMMIEQTIEVEVQT